MDWRTLARGLAMMALGFGMGFIAGALMPYAIALVIGFTIGATFTLLLAATETHADRQRR